MTLTQDRPDDLQKYAESPVFTEATVPRKLTDLHETKEGTWGRIVVLKGALAYIIPGAENKVQHLSPGVFGWIRPKEIHRVEMAGPVEFKVEFYR